MGVWLGPMGSGKFSFTVNGEKATPGTHDKYIYLYDDTTKNWEIAFLQSCKVTFFQNVEADFFLVGGGQQGQQGVAEGDYYGAKDSGGKGGKGGEVINRSGNIRKRISYPLTIGGSNENTVGFGYTAVYGGASGWSGIDGGAGGLIQYPQGPDPGPSLYDAKAGNAGVKAFNDADTLIETFAGTLFGASGGGGGVTYSIYTQNSCRLGADGGATSTNLSLYPISQYGKGHDYDNDPSSVDKFSGRQNTGQGGGGGGLQSGTIHDGAPGGSGIIIIRNHRA